MKLSALIEALGGKLVAGDRERLVIGVNSVELAGEAELVFAEDAASAAKALAAYLVSLHTDAPLFDAPMTVASAAAVTTTNSPATSEPAATNAQPATAPAK